MGIRFACHVCSKRLNIKTDLAGKRGVCPECSAKFRIPMESCERSSPVEVKQVATSTAPAQQSAQPSVSTPDPTNRSSPSNPSATANRVEKPADPVAGELDQIDALIDDPEATWYVRPPSGGQYGPADSAVLRQWIDEGRVAATALLWRDGWPQWRTASETLPGLSGRLPDKSGIGGTHQDANQSTGAVDNAQPNQDATNSNAASSNAASNASAATSAANPQGSAAQNHAFRKLPAGTSDAVDSAGVTGPTAGIAPSGDMAASNLVGDDAIGSQRRQRNHRRILTIGMLLALVIVLLGVLVFLMNR